MEMETSPWIILVKMRRKRLTPHLLLNLLHRGCLNLDRSVRMPARHFQEPARDNVQNVTVCVGFADLATFAVGFHVGRQCRGGLEDFEAFQATMVRSLVVA